MFHQWSTWLGIAKLSLTYPIKWLHLYLILILICKICGTNYMSRLLTCSAWQDDYITALLTCSWPKFSCCIDKFLLYSEVKQGSLFIPCLSHVLNKTTWLSQIPSTVHLLLTLYLLPKSKCLNASKLQKLFYCEWNLKQQSRCHIDNFEQVIFSIFSHAWAFLRQPISEDCI